jgi:uncharacterized protein
MGKKIKRLVFDTNIVISTLIFKSANAHHLRSLWAQGLLIPIISKETAEELIRVLACPKFKLSSMEQEALRDEYLLQAEACTSVHSHQSAYPCRDLLDQKFIDLALSSSAMGLMSGDQDILVMRKTFPIPIYELKDLSHL